MIVQKFWSAFVAQINKIANVFWEADPIAQMQYEYDRAVEQLKEGRTGLEQYRGLVERVTRQVAANRSHVQKLEAETKAYLKAGDRATAAKFALELQKAKAELAANEQQLQMHETAYGNNLKKIKHANEKLIELQAEDPEVRRRAEDELRGSRDRQAGPELRHEPDDGLRPDRSRHSAEDRSESRQGPGGRRPVRRRASPRSRPKSGCRRSWPKQALTDFEVELGLKSPETTPIAPATKDLGPAATDKAAEKQTS